MTLSVIEAEDDLRLRVSVSFPFVDAIDMDRDLPRWRCEEVALTEMAVL